MAYSSAPSDVEMGLDGRTVVMVEKKSSSGRIWNMCGALFFVSLCFGGALLFVQYWNGRPEMLHSPGETQAQSDTFKRTETQKMLSRLSCNATAAIHLEGDYNSKENLPGKLEWRSDGDQSFAQGGLKLHENKIIIPKTGLYFVYSQASFIVSCNDGDEEEAGNRLKPLSHRIWRYTESIGEKASLMSAVRSACQNTAPEGSSRGEHGWYTTIYLGAVFHLSQGDKLWTETNQLSELDTDEGKTFFGVFAL